MIFTIFDVSYISADVTDDAFENV